MNKIKIEKLYIYIALVFGVLFLVLTPPFESPDENSHFKRAFQISSGNIFCILKKDKCGNYFPQDMLDYISEKDSYMGDRDKKYDFSDFVSEQYTQTDYNKQSFNAYSTNQAFFPVYIPAAVGIITAKVFSKLIGTSMISSAYMIHFARFFMLLATIAIGYFAIKRTPMFKKSFFTIALLPMLLFLSSMVSYDGIVNAIFLLTLAIILDLIYKKEKIDKKDIIILVLSGIVLLNIKTIYFPIFMLMFLIPKEKFGDKKGKFKTAAIMILSIIVISVLFRIPNYINSVPKDSIESEQLSFIINHPLTYSKTLIKNIIVQRNFQMTSMVGVFGLLDTLLPFIIVFIIYMNILLTGLTDGIREKIKLSIKPKLLLILFMTLVICGAYTSMYIIWTPYLLKAVGGGEITGVQGRYFIPILVPFMLLLSTKRIKNYKLFDIISDNYFVFPIITLLVSEIAILLRFWV